MIDPSLNIVCLSSWYPNRKDLFLGNFVRAHVEAIATLHTVYMVVFEKSESESVKRVNSIINGVNEIRLYIPESKSKFSRAIIQYRFLKRLKKELPQIDIVHGHVILRQGLFFIIAKNLFRSPLVVTEHANVFLKKKINFLETYFTRFVFKSTNSVTTVSTYLSDSIYKYFGVKSTVIPNVVDIAFYNQNLLTPEKFTFCHVSTLSEVKNVQGILDAFKELCTENNSVYLKIVSDQNTSDLREMVRIMQIEEHVIIYEGLNYKDTAKEMANSSAFVLNSFSETFSVVLAEALVLGMPIISTRVGLILDFVSLPNNVFLVENNDPISLCCEMRNVMQNFKEPTLNETIRNSFSQQTVANSFNEIYRKALA
jgi:glycosyltransferase involved in cell wall biosynthesis